MSLSVSFGTQCQVESLANAVHLLNDNADAPRCAQQEQKSHVGQKEKAHLILGLRTKTNMA